MDYRPVYRDRTPRHSESMIAAYVAQGYWGEQTILERFRQIVAQRPDKEALIEGAHRFTYRQLNDQVEQTRQGLAALGLRPGDLIAVQLPNWWEQIVASLAIIDLGAVLVPVSIRLRGELKYILEFTAARAIVLPEAYHGFDHVGLVSELKPALPDLEHLVVPRLGRDLLGVVSFDRLQRMSGDSAPPAALDPNDPWEIIFTSGTTSAPKGVVRTHNNTLRTLSNLSNHYDFIRPDGSDIVLAILPVSFIFSQYLGVLSALLFGATLVLQDSFEPGAALKLLEREGVTYFGIVPSIVERFFEVEDLAQRDLSTLRYVSPAGEAVTRERKERIREAFGCDVLESYGLSEFTWPLGQVMRAGWEKKVSRTGIASPGTELAIVDAGGEPVPAGETGELLLRGPTRFPGYYGNPEATEECLDEDGWFHTGDLAQLDDDGFYAIVGRVKDVIKRKGSLIVPHEIEDALGEHPDLKDVAVVGLADPERGEIACACVVLRPGANLGTEELLSFLEGKLATFKLPERIEFLDELPVSPVGKVLKSDLKAMFENQRA